MNAPSALLLSLIEVIEVILNLYIWALVISAVISWLVAFNVINAHNRFVQIVGDFLFRITEPALRPIRKAVPSINGLDLSPLILIFIIWFIRLFLIHLVFG